MLSGGSPTTQWKSVCAPIYTKCRVNVNGKNYGNDGLKMPMDQHRIFDVPELYAAVLLLSKQAPFSIIPFPSVSST